MRSSVWGCLAPNSASVLVVDDDADTRDSLAERLALHGYRTTVADGRDAVETATNGHPAAIVLDLVMPIVDGFEVLEQLPTLETTRDIPVLCLTGLAHARQRAEEHGATAFLLKPVQVSELLAALVGLLEPPAAPAG